MGKLGGLRVRILGRIASSMCVGDSDTNCVTIITVTILESYLFSPTGKVLHGLAHLAATAVAGLGRGRQKFSLCQYFIQPELSLNTQ